MSSVKNSGESCRRSLTNSEAAGLAHLCASQTRAAMEEAACDVDALARSVLDTARYASSIQVEVSRRCDASDIETLQNDLDAIQQSVNDAGISLQFADRLNQRLSNVSTNLVALAELMNSTEFPVSTVQWIEFLKQIRAVYTVEQERQMFDAAFSATVTAAATTGEQSPDESDDPQIFEKGIHHEK